jgi:hypothetical protein
MLEFTAKTNTFPTCRGLSVLGKARAKYFVGNPPDAIVQAFLDDFEADYRSSLKMHMGYRKPHNETDSTDGANN